MYNLIKLKAQVDEYAEIIAFLDKRNTKLEGDLSRALYKINTLECDNKYLTSLIDGTDVINCIAVYSFDAFKNSKILELYKLLLSYKIIGDSDVKHLVLANTLYYLDGLESMDFSFRELSVRDGFTIFDVYQLDDFLLDLVKMILNKNNDFEFILAVILSFTGLSRESMAIYGKSKYRFYALSRQIANDILLKEFDQERIDKVISLIKKIEKEDNFDLKQYIDNLKVRKPKITSNGIDSCNSYSTEFKPMSVGNVTINHVKLVKQTSNS